MPFNGIFLINVFSNLINLILFSDVKDEYRHGQFATIKHQVKFMLS